jgi:hypothetical protein
MDGAQGLFRLYPHTFVHDSCLHHRKENTNNNNAGLSMDPPVPHVQCCTNHRQQRAKRQQHSDELGCEGLRQGQASGRQQAVHRHSARAGGVKEPAGGCVQPAEGAVPLHVQVGQQQQVLEVPAGNTCKSRLGLEQGDRHGLGTRL